MAEGRRRRSARISALENEEAKERKRGRKAEAKLPKRGRKRIKVRHVNDIDKEDEVENGEENPNHGTRDDKAEAGASQTQEKRLLKHAQIACNLDKLCTTRSDTMKDAYKIFAVPVDPNVVVGYYEIIKEPMDFLTIDAKLEQGDYKSVDEFERDVYLMLDNAMLFNDSETKYYRQASIIRDFAEMIFQSISSDPENFESEYRLPKRGRKPKCEVRRSDSTVPPALNVRSQPAVATRSQPSVVTRSQTAEAREVRRYEVFGAAQRCNGREWNSFLGDTEALISEISNCPKQLIPVCFHTINQDSLMQFVEGMGPTAQRVAKRMLEKFGATGQQGVTPTRDLNLLVDEDMKCGRYLEMVADACTPDVMLVGNGVSGFLKNNSSGSSSVLLQPIRPPTSTLLPNSSTQSLETQSNGLVGRGTSTGIGLAQMEMNLGSSWLGQSGKSRGLNPSLAMQGRRPTSLAPLPPTAENYRTRTLFKTSSGASSFETLPFFMRNQNNSTLRSQQSLVGQNQDPIGLCRTNGLNFASKVQVSSHHLSDINRMVPTSENHGIGSGQATSGLDPNAANLFQMWRQLNLQLI